MNTELHLSEAELYEELDRPEGLSGEEHLSHCAECRTEVATLRASFTGLRMAATDLAATEFRPRLEMRQPKLWNRMRAWPLSLAAAGVLCAASLTLVHHPADVRSVETAETQTAAASVPADTDDALLDGIDRDLSSSEAPSLAPLDVSAAEGAESVAKRD